jgi:hypothetical protein
MQTDAFAEAFLDFHHLELPPSKTLTFSVMVLPLAKQLRQHNRATATTIPTTRG